jgi:hypothetical protein
MLKHVKINIDYHKMGHVIMIAVLRNEKACNNVFLKTNK